MTNEQLASELIPKAPGMSPWALPSLTGLLWRGEPLEWAVSANPADASTEAIGIVWRFTNPVVLRSKHSQTVLGVVQGGISVIPHPASNTLFEFNQDIQDNVLHFRAHRIDSLEPMPAKDIQAATDYTMLIQTSERDVPAFDLPYTLSPGTYPAEFTETFRPMGTFLAFVVDRSASQWNYFLLEIDTEKHSYTVIVQDWFNKNSAEPEQWPLYAIRNPSDGRIFGEMMRSQIFILSPDARRIEEWVEYPGFEERNIVISN